MTALADAYAAAAQALEAESLKRGGPNLLSGAVARDVAEVVVDAFLDEEAKAFDEDLDEEATP